MSADKIAELIFEHDISDLLQVYLAESIHAAIFFLMLNVRRELIQFTF